MASLIYGRNSVIAAITSSRVNKITIADSFNDQRILSLAKENKIPLLKVSTAKLNELVHNSHHQGVVAEVKDYQYYNLTTLINDGKKVTNPVIIMLDGIEDPHNLGAILRIADAFSAAYAQYPQLFTMPGPNGVVTPQDWISRWIVITFGMMVFPQVSLRFFAGRNLRVIKWSAVFSSIYLTFIYLLTPCMAFVGRIMMPNLKAADTIFPEMLLKYTPTVFAALVISGALAAAMSTGDSQLHAASAMVSTDIYKKYVNKDADERSMYNVARIGVLVVGLISVIFALTKPGALANLLVLSNSGVGVLVPTIIGGLYWKHATKEGALVSTVVGEAIMVYMTFINKMSPMGFSSGFWAMMVSLVLFIVVSMATQPNKHIGEVVDSINNFFDEEE
mgnify:CR=1 FL=1